MKDKAELINLIMQGICVHDKWNINISSDVIDEIRDLCSEMLQIVGFNKNYELTEQGKILEELIDAFYVTN